MTEELIHIQQTDYMLQSVDSEIRRPDPDLVLARSSWAARMQGAARYLEEVQYMSEVEQRSQ